MAIIPLEELMWESFYSGLHGGLGLNAIAAHIVYTLLGRRVPRLL